MKTLALIKPDAFQRRLVGRIIAVAEERRFELCHVDKRRLAPKEAERFYGRQHLGKPYFFDLVGFMCSGPVMVLTLDHVGGAINKWRELMGPSDPAKRTMTSIRGVLCLPGVPLMHNLVHGSDSPESFEHEATVLGVEW